MNYTIGYDIGITSVGWCIKNDDDNTLVDFGSRIFKQANPAADARANRSARRTNRRKKWRRKQLLDAFVDFNIIDDKLVYDEEYRRFSSKKFEKINEDTIYHVRKKGLNEQLTKRELLMSMYSILRNRGHFYMDQIDFSKDTVSFELFVEKFIELTSSKFTLVLQKDLEEDYLRPIFNFEALKLPNSFDKDKNYCETKIENDCLLACLKLISNKKSNPILLLESDEDSKTVNIDDLKKRDDNSEFYFEFINLYDMINIAKFLKSHNYLCEKAVETLDEFKLISGNNKSDEFIGRKSQLKDIVTKEHKMNVIRNVANNYPNSLYLKEVNDILKTQQKYDESITDEFIEVIKSVVSAKIPYYMGPLSNSEITKNNWLERKQGKVKYSYEWAKKNQDIFDETISQKQWKERMISRCTYFPDEFALPKQAFLAELFVILNEINVLTATLNNTDYYLTMNDKINIINKIYLNHKAVPKFEQIAELLNLDSFGMRSSKSKRTIVNKTFSIYNSISLILPDLKITDIAHELNEFSTDENSKIHKIDDIILALNIFEDFQSKLEYFLDLGYSQEVASRLGKLETKDFNNFSSKFIVGTPLNKEGQSMIDILFNDNTQKPNEQMTIVSNAVDLKGNKLNLTANKYEKLLEENSSLGYHLLAKDGKAHIAMSRPVLRALNQCFIVHNEIVKLFGVPNKVVIETARDLGDPKTETPAKHYDTIKRMYDDLLAQCKKKKITSGKLDSFENIEHYLKTNKRKVELYIRQNGLSMISGEQINLDNLREYDIDHILPQGFGDNSMDNLMLISRSENAVKSNRLPLEMLADNTSSAQSYIDRVEELFGLKMISENKRKRLLLKSQEEALGFINRNIVDTRYIIKEFTSILEAHNKFHKQETKFVSLQGTFNGIFRNAIDMHKSRNVGLQHHAHDAAIIIIVDMCLNALMPNYNNGNKYSQDRYKTFLNEFTYHSEKDERQKSNYSAKNIGLLRYMYSKAFGHDYDAPESFVNEIKELVPLISYKPVSNYKGEFFNATLISPYKSEKIEVLDIVGVNNSQRKFSSINCYCVDFYKVTSLDKKGNKIKKHYAIHVPKVIIDSNGLINKNKYIALIKEHYKYDELISADGNLNEKFFRIRLKVNDIMFDTERFQPMLFNNGSIVDKILELKYIEMFSYNRIFNEYKLIYDYLELDYKQKNHGLNISRLHDLMKYYFANISPDHKLYSYNDSLEQIISEVEQYNNKLNLVKHYIEIKDKTNEKNSKKEAATLEKQLKKEYRQAYEKIAYFYKSLDNDTNHSDIIYEIIIDKILSNNVFAPSAVTDRIRPTANQLKYTDAQYVKLLYSNLGIRFDNIGNDKFNIQTVRGIKNQYKFAKNDEFTLQI